jgi:hypothetical protein
MIRALAALGLAALVAVGCLRPALPELLRESWSSVTLVLAAFASAALFVLARSRSWPG